MKNLIQKLCLFSVLILTALTLPAFAKSGTFTHVVGEVTLKSGDKTSQATPGTEVAAGDIITTGANGAAQLDMVDKAKLSLRSSSQLIVERYAQKVDGDEGAILNLVRGTLRSFTKLLSRNDANKFKMKTRAATVGIRGSFNILIADDGGTINHTVEGSHEVLSNNTNFPPLITGPNDTVQVLNGQAPQFIPTPPGMLEAGRIMVGPGEAEAIDDGGDANIPPRGPDAVGRAIVIGGSGLGYVLVDPLDLYSPTDPLGLQQAVIAGNGGTIASLAGRDGLTLDGSNLRRVVGYAGDQSGLNAAIAGGTAADVQRIDIGNGNSIVIGRWNGATGAGSSVAAPIHWGYGGAGYAGYLSDVLTGTVSYTRAGATSPTNQFGTVGALTNSVLNVNFSARTLNAIIGVSMPASATVPAGAWTLTASNVAFSLNSFFAYTGGGRLTITNATGQSSATNPALVGTLQGGFTGAALNGALIGYGFSDRTNCACGQGAQTINGVIAFQGPVQNIGATFRNGLLSDPSNTLANASFFRSYATVNRPEEVTSDAEGRATAFAGPIARGPDIVGHATYAQGSATVLENGADAATGLIWGRWSGGSATVGGQAVALTNRSLHYIFSSAQNGPTALPLTGSATYDVIGSTRPTDLNGNVGTFNSAALSANFSARTVNTSLNITIAGQTWNAAASNVPIYRAQYFATYAGAAIANVAPAGTLTITCAPSCTPVIPSGSIDGFFTGRTGRGAGVMYNLNSNISGAIAFRRRG